MAKLVKKQIGGFATSKNTMSQKELSKSRAAGKVQAKEAAKANKKREEDIKKGKIVKLQVTKGPWFKKGGTVNTKNKK